DAESLLESGTDQHALLSCPKPEFQDFRIPSSHATKPDQQSSKAGRSAGRQEKTRPAEAERVECPEISHAARARMARCRTPFSIAFCPRFIPGPNGRSPAPRLWSREWASVR